MFNFRKIFIVAHVCLIQLSLPNKNLLIFFEKILSHESGNEIYKGAYFVAMPEHSLSAMWDNYASRHLSYSVTCGCREIATAFMQLSLLTSLKCLPYITFRIDCICVNSSVCTSPRLRGTPNTPWSGTSSTICGFPSLWCQLFCMSIQIYPSLVWEKNVSCVWSLLFWTDRRHHMQKLLGHVSATSAQLRV
jgi:hypothetical protein